ncbi:hypothetical protein CSW47_10055 [Thermus scotoductus]|uniref:DUF4129 domain-containing protein n=1 Tax=Thermus scotoductus TaxID=37636 RepID=A0A430R5Y5_THESC|nr:hypothetical protein CSW47_10055 [Thermus scotoductus]
MWGRGPKADLALAFFLADRDPLWAVVALFYGVHHLLIALSLERAPGPFTPRKYSEALSLFRQAGLAKGVRKAYEKLLELSWQARYEPLTREEGRELWREALEAYKALREALGGTGGPGA